MRGDSGSCTSTHHKLLWLLEVPVPLLLLVVTSVLVQYVVQKIIPLCLCL